MTADILWLFVFIALYWAYCTYWGVEGAERAGPAAGFFLGDRSVPWWVFVLTATAACIGGSLYIMLPALLARDGFQAGYVAYGSVAMALAGALLMKRQWIAARRFGYVTPAGLYGNHFESEAIRSLVVFVALVFAIPFAGIHLFATGMLVEGVSGGAVDRVSAMWILSAALFLHIVLGGMRAVAFAGTLQCVLAFAGVLALGGIAYFQLGGFAGFNEALGKLGATTASYLAVPGVMQFTAGLGEDVPVGGMWTSAMIFSYLLALMGLVAAPGMSQLVISCRSPRAFAPQQVWASAAAVGLLLLFFVSVIGMGAQFIGAAPGDQLSAFYIKLVSSHSPWFLGLLTLCGIAAMQAMVGLHVSAAGSILSRDVYRRYFNAEATDRDQVKIARIAIFFVMLAALLIATYSTELLMQSGGLAMSYGAQLMVPLAGLCWFRWMTREGAVTGLGIGLLVATFTDNFGLSLLGFAGLDMPWGRWPWTIHSAGWGLVANAVACVLISLASNRYSASAARERTHDYFRAVDGFPAEKRRLRPVAWGIALIWVFLAIGPGIVIGNDIFGAPAAGRAGWGTGIPSIWAWQILWWGLGTLMVWFLAYKMEFSTIPRTHIEPLADTPRIGLRDPIRAELRWLWPAAAFVAALTAINWAFR